MEKTEKEEKGLPIVTKYSGGYQAACRAVCVDDLLELRGFVELSCTNEAQLKCILEMAICQGAKQCIGYLLSKHVKPNSLSLWNAYDYMRDSFHWSLEKFCEHGLDLTRESSNLLDHLIRSAEMGAFEEILRFGYSVNASDSSGATLLHIAADCGNTNAIRMLVHYHADLNARNSQGETPLILAAKKGSLSVVGTLIEEGADLTVKSEDGWTVLHYAAAAGYTECLRMLLQSAHVVSAPNETGTALMAAANYGRIETMQLLLDDGRCDVNAHDSFSGMTALHRAADRGSATMVSLLLQYDTNPDTRDQDGATPLSLAVNSNHVEVTQLLVAHIGVIDQDGFLFELAVRRGYVDIVRCLALGGCNLTVAGQWTDASRVPWGFARDPPVLDFVRKLLTDPSKLTALCRISIRTCLGFLNATNLSMLHLPLPLQKYLMFEEEFS